MHVVAFRVDSTLSIGSGHFSRCFAIASELMKIGIETHFITRSFMPWQASMLASIGAQIHRLPLPHDTLRPELNFRDGKNDLDTVRTVDDARMTNNVLEKISCSHLFVDSYLANRKWGENLSHSCKKIQITDFQDNFLDFDYCIRPGLISNQSFDEVLNHDGSRFFSGPLLAPLDRSFRFWKGAEVLKDERLHTLIYLGSGDYTKFLKGLVDAWKSTRTFDRLTLISSGPKLDLSRLSQPSFIKTIAYLQPPLQIHEHIKNHNSFLGAAGVSMLERFSQGQISALTLESSNQSETYKSAIDIGLGFGLGSIDSANPDEIYHAIERSKKASSNSAKRVLARSFSDGFGAQRIMYLCRIASIPRITVRPATPLDISTLYRIANEPQSRRMSGSLSSITPEEHYEWFQHKLGENSEIFIAELDECPIGMVRFDYKDEIQSLLSFAIDKPFRGYGLASEMLNLSLEKRKNKNTVLAKVKRENEASIRTLLSTGFRFKQNRKEYQSSSDWLIELEF